MAVMEQNRSCWYSRYCITSIRALVKPTCRCFCKCKRCISLLHSTYHLLQEHEGPINPEQTSSIFSILSASYLDPLVWQSRKVKHLALDMLPPQLSGDKMSALSSTFFYLDPFNLPRRQTNVYTGLLRAFRTSWCLQILIMACNALLALGSPVGVNGLLLNIESGGQGATVKRWAWILLITLGKFEYLDCVLYI